MAEAYEHCSEPSGFIEAVEFLDQRLGIRSCILKPSLFLGTKLYERVRHLLDRDGLLVMDHWQ